MKDSLKSLLALILNFIGPILAKETVIHTFVAKIKENINDAKNRFKRAAFGSAIILVAIIFWLTTVIFLFLAVFCRLGLLDHLVPAAALTATISLAVALLITLIGLALIKSSHKKSS